MVLHVLRQVIVVVAIVLNHSSMMM